MEKSSFSDRLRVRACAIIPSGRNLLLVEHQSPTRSEPIWMPPGGEVNYGETLEAALIREVEEETGLRVDPVRLICVHEFLEKPYHAVEFYYECSVVGGMLKLGQDPELPDENQMLLDLKFVSASEAAEMSVYPDFLRKFFSDGSLSVEAGETYKTTDESFLSSNG